MNLIPAPHVGNCPKRWTGHGDESRRISDHVNQHTQSAAIGIVWETVQGKWMAFNLNDGRSDGVLYDTKGDAARHTDEMTHFYLKLRADLMTQCEAEIMLSFHRKARIKGFPQADPDSKKGGREIIPRLGLPEMMSQLKNLR